MCLSVFARASFGAAMRDAAVRRGMVTAHTGIPPSFFAALNNEIFNASILCLSPRNITHMNLIIITISYNEFIVAAIFKRKHYRLKYVRFLKQYVSKSILKHRNTVSKLSLPAGARDGNYCKVIFSNVHPLRTAFVVLYYAQAKYVNVIWYELRQTTFEGQERDTPTARHVAAKTSPRSRGECAGAGGSHSRGHRVHTDAA